jgi:hypothetical protein
MTLYENDLRIWGIIYILVDAYVDAGIRDQSLSKEVLVRAVLWKKHFKKQLQCGRKPCSN